MLIDYFTQRYTFSGESLWLSLVAFTVAGAAVLLHRRRALYKTAKIAEGERPRFRQALLQNLPSGLWALIFFLLTGCLRESLQEVPSGDSPSEKRKRFFFGLLHLGVGAVAVTLIHSVVAIFGELAWVRTVMLFTGAFTCAYVSALIFYLLPLPGSDADRLLRTKEPGEKGAALRRDGTFPFLIFTLLGLFLACIPVVWNGATYTLSGILTMFPVFLIGG